MAPVQCAAQTDTAYLTPAPADEQGATPRPTESSSGVSPGAKTMWPRDNDRSSFYNHLHDLPDEQEPFRVIRTHRLTSHEGVSVSCKQNT